MDDTRERYITLFIDFGVIRLFEQAKIAKHNLKELRDYEKSVKVYRDLFNVVNTAEKKGIAKGFAEGEAWETNNRKLPFR